MTTVKAWISTQSQALRTAPAARRTAPPSRCARRVAAPTLNRTGRTQPERQLVGAVLTPAIDDLLDRRPSPQTKARRQLARAWIAGALAVVTFEAVCQALDLDAAAVRDAAPRPRALGC
jgi:hypothetical protein